MLDRTMSISRLIAWSRAVIGSRRQRRAGSRMSSSASTTRSTSDSRMPGHNGSETTRSNASVATGNSEAEYAPTALVVRVQVKGNEMDAGPDPQATHPFEDTGPIDPQSFQPKLNDVEMDRVLLKLDSSRWPTRSAIGVDASLRHTQSRDVFSP